MASVEQSDLVSLWLLDLLRSRWRLVAICGALGLALAFAYFHLATPRYTTEFVLRAGRASESAPIESPVVIATRLTQAVRSPEHAGCELTTKALGSPDNVVTA